VVQIRWQGKRRDGRSATGPSAVMPWPDLAGGVSFNVPGHHRAWEDHRKQEKLEASSMDGSEGATMAWW